MLKFNFCLIMLFSSISTMVAQSEIITNSGQTIIIEPNGTWKIKPAVSSGKELYVLSNGDTLIISADKTWKRKVNKITELVNTIVEGTFLEKTENHIYPTIKINNQVWMSENLNVSHFRNGDLIPEAKTLEEWEAALDSGKPAWCHYNNNENNGIKYGKFYNKHAIRDQRGLAPYGYHIPSILEWEILINKFGGQTNAAKYLKSNNYWVENSGTNSSKFSALPSGMKRNSANQNFCFLGESANWWAIDGEVNMSSGNFGVRIIKSDYDNDGRMIRCVKDDKL